MNYLEGNFHKEDVDCVVFGKPMRTDHRQSESFVHVERFVQAFRKRFPGKKIAWEDERYTSKIARQQMVEGGMKKSNREIKGNVDKMSAVLILQSFMQGENNP